MRLKFIVLVSIFISGLVLSGCSENVIQAGPMREASIYTEDSILPEIPVELEVSVESGNVEIYSWDSDEVRFEATRRMRGVSDQNTLNNNLENYIININQQDGRITFLADYKGEIKNPSSVSLDLRIYLPKEIASINCNVDAGKVKFIDDLKCILKVCVKTANVEINRFEGLLNFTAVTGDLRIGGGWLADGSDVSIDMGNITIRSQLEEEGKYSFDTNFGNVELVFPRDSGLIIDGTGIIDVNEFESTEGSPKLLVRSGIGKILIKKSR